MKVRSLGAGILALLLLAACGDPKPEVPLAALLSQLSEARDAALEEAIQEIGRRGAADPETVVPKLIDLMHDERLDPLVNTFRFTLDLTGSGLEPAQYAKAVSGAVALLANRLKLYGYASGHFVSQARSPAFTMTLPRPNPAELDPDDPEGKRWRLMQGEARKQAEAQWIDVLLRRLEQPGRFGLFATVEPPAEDATPESLWKGSRESFDRFVEKETPRLEQAQRERTAYRSSRSDFGLALLRPARPGDGVRRVVLRLPLGDAERFGTDNIEIRRGKDPESGDLVLVLTVADEAVERLRTWSRSHTGRGLALVVNGRAEVVVPITEPLDKMIVLHLGPEDDPHVGVWMEGIMRGLEAGSLAHPLRGELISDLPPGMLTPVVRAIAAVGEPAAPYLVKLAKAGGDIGQRATRALEHLRRRLLTPPPDRGG